MQKLSRKEVASLGGKAVVEKRGRDWMVFIGRLGGNALYCKYGHDWMVELGRRGAAEFNRLYMVLPYGTSEYQIVSRENNEVIAIF